MENEYMSSPDGLIEREKYKNPSKLITQKKKQLLETARQRILDKKDETGFRAALRSALSCIANFSAEKANISIDKKSQTMTGKEQVLDEFSHIKSWQELIDNSDKIFSSVEYKASVIYQRTMRAAIEKEIMRPMWVKSGNQKIGRYDAETNFLYRQIQDIWTNKTDPLELQARLKAAQTAMKEAQKKGVDYDALLIDDRLLNTLAEYRLSSEEKIATRGNRYLSDIYEALLEIRLEANAGKIEY